MSASNLTLTIMFVVGGLVLLRIWTRVFADLLWMLALRSGLVAIVTLGTFFVVVGFGHLLFGIPVGSASIFALGVLATPLIARPLTDVLAFRLAGGSETLGEDAIWRGYVFSEIRRWQDANYEAPPIGPE